ncbi:MULTISPECIES: hypothetical protein [unclassified Streptomyces]|nr:hypothetical protein [Streptomyces sp. NBC_01689]
MGDVPRRVPGGAFGVGSGPPDRLIDPAAGCRQRQPHPRQFPFFFPLALGGEGVEVCQAFGRPILVGAQFGQSVDHKFVIVPGLSLCAHHGDRLVAATVPSHKLRESRPQLLSVHD